MPNNPILLFSALRAAIPVASPSIYIAYSGGVDSHVLLHACTELIEFKGKITAVYVHHGLQAIAEDWAIHCQREAEKLGVNFQLLRVKAQAKNGESPEEAARNARYQALQTLLDEKDVLLVAQHREDQLETVLLQLFRGAGVQGLAAMPKTMPFGKGQLLRPFLDVPKSAILAYAQQFNLMWITDPTNACDDFDRNFLRNQLIPLIKTRWTQVDKTVSRSAYHCAAAQDLLQDMAENLFAVVRTASPLKDWQSSLGQSLSINRLKQFNQQKQQLIIRYWFKTLDLQMPSSAFIAAILTEVIEAKSSATPALKKNGLVIRRYQDTLYCLKDLPGFKNLEGLIWQAIENKVILPDNSVLERRPADSGIPIALWQTATVTVRFRQGGEKIRLAGRNGQHRLKNLLHDAGIPPWQRDTLPLIYFDDRLVAVANLWLSADVQSDCLEPCYQIEWFPGEC
jgi:tRNA(Ile)-lysidine synthase